MTTVFLTGGTGFIGRRLVCTLGATHGGRVRCLTRSVPDPVRGVEFIRGDLMTPDAYAGALRGTDTVLHLAATTGKAKADDHVRVNVGGTRALLRACRDAGVTRFVYVSSIAAGYRDATAYHYATSKMQAEEAVRTSGLTYIIVRPTLVLGYGSPIWNSLTALAAFPITPVLGDGRVRVQPIYVDDVVAFLASMVDQPVGSGQVIELGGPNVVTMEELLRRVRRAWRGADAPVLHVPAKPAIAVLAWAERRLSNILPITAGQLAVFVNDSAARPDPAIASRVPGMKTIDEMLQLLSHG